MTVAAASTIGRTLGESSFSGHPDSILVMEFFDPAHDRRHVYIATIDASVPVESIVPANAQIVRSFTEREVTAVLARTAEATFYARIGTYHTRLMIGADTAIEAKRLVEIVTSQFGQKCDGHARVSIWHFGGTGPSCQRRLIACPEWPEITRNYPAATRTRLADLIALSHMPDGGGRLILWHGEPGTGKTTALRALIKAWAPWCASNYMSDPERFFADPNYLIAVVNAETLEDAVMGRPGPARARLIIAEDCDDSIRANPRRDGGAALGRLLNLTDGILGQALPTLVLLTTNEPVGRLHPALIRPGRCLDVTEFARHNSAEATQWLGRPSASPMTVAELCAHTRVSTVRPPAQPELVTGQYL